MSSRYAIVMLSLGERRTWKDHAFGSFEAVAERWNADAHLVTHDDAAEIDTSDLLPSPGRPNKRPYALKSYYAWKFLTQGGYSKVLMVDDTCVIHPQADHLFDAYQSSKLAVKKTSRVHARGTFKHIRRLVAQGEADPVTFDEMKYGNTGVVLYDHSIAEAFSPEQINAARQMLYAKFPHQTLFYYLSHKAEIPVDRLEARWNRAPRGDLSPDEWRALASADDFINLKRATIMHFTGAYANRKQLVESLAASYRAMDAAPELDQAGAEPSVKRDPDPELLPE